MSCRDYRYYETWAAWFVQSRTCTTGGRYGCLFASSGFALALPPGKFVDEDETWVKWSSNMTHISYKVCAITRKETHRYSSLSPKKWFLSSLQYNIVMLEPTIWVSRTHLFWVASKKIVRRLSCFGTCRSWLEFLKRSSKSGAVLPVPYLIKTNN